MLAGRYLLTIQIAAWAGQVEAANLCVNLARAIHEEQTHRAPCRVKKGSGANTRTGAWRASRTGPGPRCAAGILSWQHGSTSRSRYSDLSNSQTVAQASREERARATERPLVRLSLSIGLPISVVGRGPHSAVRLDRQAVRVVLLVSGLALSLTLGSCLAHSGPRFKEG